MGSATDIPIGKRIRKDRDAKGLSIEGLSYLAGVSYKTIERIEAGESQPRRATLTCIQRALDEFVPEDEAA